MQDGTLYPELIDLLPGFQLSFKFDAIVIERIDPACGAYFKLDDLSLAGDHLDPNGVRRGIWCREDVDVAHCHRESILLDGDVHIAH